MGQTQSTLSTPEQNVASPYMDHAFATLSPGDRVTLGYLEAETAGNLSVGAFEKMIQTVLLPVNVREVLLDIGWQNFTAGNPPLQSWVNLWLSACDAADIRNVLYVGQLTTAGFNSRWVNSVIAKDPAAATYYSNGTRAAFISLDNPDVAHYLERDLGMIYSYYGSHTSWVGLGTGSANNDPYYSEASVPSMGYSNITISDFVNSPYYNADVNGTGYLPNGELDALWSEYRSVQPGIVLSSGLWMTSSPYDVYGSGPDSNYVEMRFKVPTNAQELQIQWYGFEVGTPADLQVAIFRDKSGSLSASQEVANLNESASSFTNSTGWQSGVHVPGGFSAGWYWAKFSSPTSDKTNHYTFYLKDYTVNNATAEAAQPQVGPGFVAGSTILWLQNQSGETLTVYPYQEAFVGAPAQLFRATHPFSFNAVLIFLSDRPYNTENATLTVTDLTDGSKELAAGLLSQALNQGLENWVPIALNNTVTTVTGHEYSLTVNDPSNAWVPIMRYVATSPPQAGFQGQSQTLLFELGNLNWTQGFKGLGGITSNGRDAVATDKIDAVRFSPSSNETLSSLEILMYTTSAVTSTNYTSGTMTVAVWASGRGGLAPQGPPLQQLIFPGTSIPRDGFFHAAGFNLTLTTGRSYWIVFSANSTDGFTFARLTSPFEFLVKVSYDGGNSWYDPSEGPTELAFVISLSSETIGTYVTGQTLITLAPSSIFAQPFFAKSDSSVDGVYIGPLLPGPRLLVSIVPSAADGEPTDSPIASGIFNAGNITLDYGPEFVQFSSVAMLNQGDEYWITIQPIRGSYKMVTLQYLASYQDLPTRISAAVSRDSGLTWKGITNSTTTVATIPEYLITALNTSRPRLDTRELSHYLATYHNVPVLSGKLGGWSAYLQASELETYNEVTQWVSNFTGRPFEFYTSANANVLGPLNLKGVISVPVISSTLACSELLKVAKVSVAMDTSQFAYASLSALQRCGSDGASAFAQLLNYSPYLGKNFGLGTSNDILVVGDQPSSNITSLLSNVFNTTYVDFRLHSTLPSRYNISSFSAVLWLTSGNIVIPPALYGLLNQYVQGGGELVTTDSSLARLGPSKSVIPVVTSQYGYTNASSFLKRALAHTSYANDSLEVEGNNTTLTARGANLTISESTLERGKIVFVDFGNSPFIHPGDQSLVISNLLSAAVNVSPPLWYQLGASEEMSTTEYSIEGTNGGRLLIWAYNPSSSASLLSLHLNGSYFGVPSVWKTVGLPELNVTAGSGSDVEVQTTIPPRTLVGILVVPASEPLISFSSGLLRSQYTYPDQSLYSIAADYNQSVLVMISTSYSAGQILFNDQSSVPQLTSLRQFNNAKTAWFFATNTDSLYVKFQSTGVDTLRFLFHKTPLPQVEVLPESPLAVLFVATLALEIAVLSLLIVRRKIGPNWARRN